MRLKQKKALLKYHSQLRKAFTDALATLTEPGNARTWFVPYLAAVLATYNEARTKTIDGRRLSSRISKTPRRAIKKLIGETCDRDRQMRSRWAKALFAAYNAGVSPEKLGRWFRQGGGVSGRAR